MTSAHSARTDEQIVEAATGPGAPEDLAFDHTPAFARLRWRPDGSLWVEPVGRPCRDDALGCFGELAPDGTLRRHVDVVAPAPDLGGRLLLLEDGPVVDRLLAHLRKIGGNEPHEGTAQRGLSRSGRKWCGGVTVGRPSPRGWTSVARSGRVVPGFVAVA